MKKAFFLFPFLLIHLFTTETLKVSPQSAPGSPVQFYSPQIEDNLEDTLVHSIRNAKASIVLFTYTLKSAKVIRALNEAARSGVQVDAVYDSIASAGVEKKLCEKVHAVPRRIKGLMHLKLLIIDRKNVWFGSANITRDSLNCHANLVTHLDHEEFANAVLLKGEQVLGACFEKPIPPQNFIIGNQNLELRFLPDDETAIDRIKELIGSAKKSIRVAMFTFTREDLAGALIQASKRGVKVEVAIELSTTKNASKKVTALLQKNGIFVAAKDTGGMLHHKFMWIDGQVLEHGSANWTQAAFKNNDDYIMIIDPLNSNQNQALENIWKAIMQS